MKLKMVVAAASLLLAGSAMAGSVVYPDDTLGTLSPIPALFGDLKSGKPGGETFSDSFTFKLGGNSIVTGSVGELFGSVTFSNVLIDGTAETLTNTDTGWGFVSKALGEGSHTLKVEGSIPKGGHAYIGSVYATPAVPEPESMALVAAGVGVMGLVARRRQRR